MASVACRPMCVGRLTHAISDSAAAALDVPGSQLFRVICHAAGRSLQCDGGELLRVSSESADQLHDRRTAQRSRARRRRSAETSEQTEARRAVERSRSERRRQAQKSAVPESFEVALIDIDDTSGGTLCETFVLHTCGTLSWECKRCQAQFFLAERSSTSSCCSPQIWIMLR